MIAVNTLIKWGQDNDKESVERILWLDRQQNLAYVINIYSNESPFPRCISDIEECIKQGIAGLLDSDVFCKSFLPKVANNFSIVLQLHFP